MAKSVKNKNEFVSLMKTARDIMPLLSVEIPFDDVEIFFSNIFEIKKIFDVIQSEFDCYEVYPRHKFTKYHESCSILNEFCETAEIKIKWFIDIDVEFNERNWSVYKDINPLARFYYNGIEITGFISSKK